MERRLFSDFRHESEPHPPDPWGFIMAERTLLSLDKVDPEQAWQPWKPDEQQPWNLKWAGHLFRRAGFGASLEELNTAVTDGLKTTVDRILLGEKGTEEFYNQFLFPSDPKKTETGLYVARENNGYKLRSWWLYALYHSPHPLREKMTLFWHNHFVSSIAKVQSGVKMYNQNKLLRKYALGKFPPFLLDISMDAAMLDYLDSNSNINSKPNENYAREVMELFTLGVGNYTEKDVQEAARAFTGWHTNGADAFEFNKHFHDFGTKTVLGQKGEWNGDDVVRIILEQPVAARFLVRKLYRFFISENAEPPDALLAPLADAFRKSEYNVAGVLGTILRSRHFFSEHAYRQRVKSPVEFALGAAKAVGLGLVFPGSLAGRIDDMGQQLFAPPNVKGWPGGKSWLNTSTVLARHNFAQALSSGTSDINKGIGEDGPRVAVIVDPSAYFRRQKITEPEKILDTLSDMVFQDDLGTKTRNRLLTFLNDGDPKGPTLDQRVRETVHALMCMPEYQLA
jgi:hypothetical protein